MALRKCTDCGGEISTRAVSCPHCGADRRMTTFAEERQRRSDYWFYTLLLGLAIWAIVDKGSPFH